MHKNIIFSLGLNLTNGFEPSRFFLTWRRTTYIDTYSRGMGQCLEKGKQCLG